MVMGELNTNAGYDNMLLTHVVNKHTQIQSIIISVLDNFIFVEGWKGSDSSIFLTADRTKFVKQLTFIPLSFSARTTFFGEYPTFQKLFDGGFRGTVTQCLVSLFPPSQVNMISVLYTASRNLVSLVKFRFFLSK